MRNDQLVHSNLAIGIDTVARSTKLDGMVPVEKSTTTTGESNCTLLFFFVFYGSDAQTFRYEKGTIVLEAIDRKGCLMIVLSRTSFRYTEKAK